MTFAVENTRPGETAGPPMFRTVGGALPVSRPNNESHIIPADNPQLSYVSPMLVEKLRYQLRAQTAECVMATFGISINTWTKMRKGLPIRRSVANRLLRRVGLIDL